MRALLCHNPTAGAKGHDKDSILAALKLAGIEASYVSVRESDFARHLDRPLDLIVAAGGDGTIGRVITALPDRSVPVAILPLGTANNFARSLGIAGTPQELAETWHVDHICPVNVGKAEGPWGATPFIEGFGVGVFPVFLKNAAARRRKPAGADGMRKGRQLLQKALKAAKPFDIAVEIDGKTFDQPLLGVEVCNVTFTGPGLPLAATADVSDSKLDVVFVTEDDRAALIDWLEAPLENKPPVTVRKGAEIVLTWKRRPSRVDDEMFDGDKRKGTVTIGCDREAARVLIPVKLPTQRKHERKAAVA